MPTLVDLITTAAVPGFVGFAVGRTTFWEPLTEMPDGIGVSWRFSRKRCVLQLDNRREF